jgi:hypothetical protein
VDKPAFLSEHSVDGLGVDVDALAEAKHGPDAAVAERRVLVDEFLHSSDQLELKGSTTDPHKPSEQRLLRASVPDESMSVPGHAQRREGRVLCNVGAGGYSASKVYW